MDILLKFYTWMYYYTCRYRCAIAEAYGDILLYILYYYTIYYYIYIYYYRRTYGQIPGFMEVVDRTIHGYVSTTMYLKAVLQRTCI